MRRAMMRVAVPVAMLLPSASHRLALKEEGGECWPSLLQPLATCGLQCLLPCACCVCCYSAASCHTRHSSSCEKRLARL